ncbi:hypothetical protein BTURTLESOX_1262 [bacterium endosymbiont of Bathymodiolus sp. 5 South]|nr:hypothetical protein BTURTLESOX_1262 [bacterium endosymbiont of Bathymodiolus sp. 5 South]
MGKNWILLIMPIHAKVSINKKMHIIIYFYVYNMHGGVSKYYKDFSSFKVVIRFMPVIRFIQAK